MDFSELLGIFHLFFLKGVRYFFEDRLKDVFLLETEDWKRFAEVDSFRITESFEVRTEAFDEAIVQIGVPPVSVAVYPVQVDKVVCLDFDTLFDYLFVLVVEAL